jgi:signal transduction histidine kinase
MAAGLRVQTNIPAGLSAVAMETGPLQTVLGHLLENAVEACPSGGTISVTARSVELAGEQMKMFLGRVGPGAHVEVLFADTGTGIKPEVRRRLFVEPFYTTKVRHRGLGLAIVYRILCSHRGGIQIEPAPNSGTLVRIVIPLAVARPPVAPAGPVGTTAVGG